MKYMTFKRALGLGLIACAAVAMTSCGGGGPEVMIIPPLPTPTAPDLDIRNFRVNGSPSDATLTAGASFTIRADVHNFSFADPASGVILRYYRSTNNVISRSDDTRVGSDTVGSLGAGQTSSQSITLTAPTTAGAYYYGACVDEVAGERDPGDDCTTNDEAIRVTVTGTTPPGMRPVNFPPPVPPLDPPQASGSNIPNLFIAGVGTTMSLTALNNTGRAITISAGTYFEPTDGGVQRMIVTQSTRLIDGRVSSIPAACRQQNKRTPPNGLRFFSQSKRVGSSTVDVCQRNCLSESSSDIQSCVWGCETSTRTPTPPTRSYGALATTEILECFSGNRGPNLAWAYVTGHSTQQAAQNAALSDCRNSANSRGTCAHNSDFGSAYSGRNECLAMAYGVTSSRCLFTPARENSVREAESAALAACRSAGATRCWIPTGSRRGRASVCSN